MLTMLWLKALQDVVRAVRNTRADYNVELGRRIPATIHVSDANLRSEPASLPLLGVKNLFLGENTSDAQGSAGGRGECHLAASKAG